MEILCEVLDRVALEAKTDLLEGIEDELLKMPKVIRNISDVFPNMVGLLLHIRNKLRKEKDYAFADQIRQRLAANCIIVDDQGADKSTYRLEAK
jgi:cysteinyl-tRNA synthetase